MPSDVMKITRNNLVEILWVRSSYSSVEDGKDGNTLSVVR